MRAAAAAVCLLICSPALAESPSGKVDAATRHQADELWKHGKTLYNLGHFAEAVAAWEKAYELIPSETAFLYNLAQAYRKTSQHEKALFSYRTFLRETRDVAPTLRTQIEQQIVELQKLVDDEQRVRQAPPDSAEPNVVAAHPAPPPTTIATSAEVSKPAAPPATPIYRRWWLWTTVAVVVVAAVAVGLAVGLSSGGNSDYAVWRF